MGEILFTPGRQKQPEEKRSKEVRGQKARNKKAGRQVESPKSVRGKNNDLEQAEYLGDFFEKVVPVRIAAEVIKDYKEKVEKGKKGVYKDKYANPEEYKKAVGEVSNKIAQGFKFFEKKIYDREESTMLARGEVSIKEFELDNVFEGKNIMFFLKEGDVAKKEYEDMLEFQEFLPNNMPKIYDYIRLGDKGMLIMEKIEDDTLGQLFNSDLNALLKDRPKIFSGLGKIVGVMDNNNFIHGDLYRNNIMLSNECVWKIIDFEFSKHHEGRKFIKAKTYNLKQLNIDEISDKFKNKSIKSDFYEGYLLSRNLKEDIRFMSKEKQFNKAETANYVKGINKMINSILLPSEETREYFVSLISEIDHRMEELGEGEKEDKTFKKRTDGLRDFKNGIEKFLEKKMMAK